MEVFISWSGARSEAVAKALREWIPNVIQAVKPWMSATDIEKGARWASEIATHLNQSRCGISCLTPENLGAPWLLFEAGAMSNHLEKPFVCSYLFGLEYADVKEPFAQFQATKAEKRDSLKLIQTINGALLEAALDKEQLQTAFEKWWPDLEMVLKSIPDLKGEPKPQRDIGETLEEILAFVREQTRLILNLQTFISGPRTGLSSLLGPGPSVLPGKSLADVLTTREPFIGSAAYEEGLAQLLKLFGEKAKTEKEARPVTEKDKGGSA